jgi:endonuclease/exonuclease/phosphatase family metal-dependent hydrolase
MKASLASHIRRFGILILALASVHSAATEVAIISANIRVALPEDEARGFGWSMRRELCGAVIMANRPDIICLQEVLPGQQADLESRWPDFATFGFAGPEMDIRLEGYHGIAKNPIFYSRDRFDLISAGGFWLSETPHLPGSLSWGSARARHVNWVRLRERAPGRELRVLNTHLDHLGQPARERQMQMILDEAAQYAPDFPQVLAGDLNAHAANPVVAAIIDAGWSDTYAAVHGPADPGFTAHAFLGENFVPAGPFGKIDFVFVRGRIRAVAAAIIRDRDGELYPSDHFFVSARLRFD